MCTSEMATESIIREEFTFEWKIENYSSCYQKNKEYIRSSVFTVESLGRSKWFVDFYPRIYDKDEENTYCYLCRTEDDNGDEKIVINEKVDIIGADGEILESRKFENGTYTKGGYLGWKFMKFDDLTKAMESCKEDILTIRYHITGSETRKRLATGCEAKTKIGVDRCSFQWNVANFDIFAWEESKEFPFPMTSHIEITLTAPEDDLLIKIRKKEDNPSISRLVTCRMSLLDIEGVERHSKRDTHLFDNKDEISSWEFPSFITKTHLNSEEHTFLKNGTFTLVCELSVSNGIQSGILLDYRYDNSSEVDIFPRIDTFSSLKEDLRTMFTSEKYLDVKLQVGNDIFPAHKSLLAARSAVFSAMFDQDMLESQTGVVNIPDVEAKTLKSFLEFMYTGTVENMNDEITLKLLVVADKYQVVSLKEKCASFLMSGLSDGNVCQVLVVADKVGLVILKESVLDYIKSRLGKILLSREWSQWIEKNVRLASETLSKLSIEFGTLADKVSVTYEEGK